MDQRERLRAEIDHATSDLVAKVNSLEDRAVEVRHRIQRNFELEYQARERPWTVFGSAVAAGMILGLIFG
jgi:ElaB/YqjD/DUF883 family membrane-anchored ribosome-binding protein